MVSLANIIVGVFDELANAQAARDALLEAGVREEHIRISRPERPQPRKHDDDDDPDDFWSNIRDYFGIDDDEQDADDDPMLEGAVLTVVAQKDTMDRIAQIVEQFEPARLDRSPSMPMDDDTRRRPRATE